jgi:hypothetical protein
MGHWEQTGRDNAEERARRAALPRWRRVVASHGLAAFLALLWIVMAVSLLRLFGMV